MFCNLMQEGATVLVEVAVGVAMAVAAAVSERGSTVR
jgi:hypothetical protein